MKKLLVLLILSTILISISGCPEQQCPQGHCVAPESTEEAAPSESTEKTEEVAPESNEKSE